MIFNSAVQGTGGGAELLTGEIDQSSSGDLTIPVKIEQSDSFVVFLEEKYESGYFEINTPCVVCAYRINGVEGCIEIDTDGAPPRSNSNGVLFVDAGNDSTTLIHPYGFPQTAPEQAWRYLVW